MVKCEICKRELAQLFLGKIKGATTKDPKGKKHHVCFECQKKFPSKEEQLKNMPL